MAAEKPDTASGPPRSLSNADAKRSVALPVLDILDENGRLRRHDAGMWVSAAMTYPHDDARRDELVKAGVFRGLVKAGRDIPPDIAKSGLNTMVGVDGSVQDNFNAAYDNGLMAGEVLVYVVRVARQFPEKASIRQASRLVAHARKNAKRRDGTALRTGETLIREAWREYRPVAHLWAGLIHYGYDADVLNADYLATFLGTADAFGRFAVHHQIPGTNDRLIAGSKIWDIPTFDGLPITEIDAPILTKDERKALFSYQHERVKI